MRFVLFALVPSLVLAGTAIGLLWYVRRAWRDWRRTGSLGIGYGLAAAPGSVLFALTRNQQYARGELALRSRLLVLGWLAVCVVLAMLLLAAAAGWLAVGSDWGAGTHAGT